MAHQQLAHGAAAYGAGIGPAGHDPPDEPSEKVTQATVAANSFDPYNRVWTQNDDLTMVEASPNIQRAAMLMLPLRGIPSVAGSGIDLVRIRRALPSRRAATIEEELRRAWKVLLDQRLISIEKIVLSSPWTGAWDVEVKDLVYRQDGTLSGTTG
jgi:hypothetical protein